MTRGGQFTSLDAKGEVVDKAKLDGIKGKVIIKEGVYVPVVDAAIFDEAQAAQRPGKQPLPPQTRGTRLPAAS